MILPFQGMGQWKSFQVFKGDTINCEDVKGLKQGVWKKYYRNNTLCSETMFTNNKPSGISRTWYESGKLKAEVFFHLMHSGKIKLQCWWEIICFHVDFYFQ